MKKILIGVYNPTIILTYIGVFCALVGTGMLLYLQPTGFNKTMDIIMILLISAGVCDMFDGAVARRFKRTEQEKDFGIQLDSLADTVSFVVFPAVFMMTVSASAFISVPIACLYVFGGIMRLGWFNVTTEENKGFYKGLPVTFTSIIFPTCYAAMRILNLEYMHIVFPILFGCVALLFILNFKLKKARMPLMMFLAGLAVAGVIVLALI